MLNAFLITHGENGTLLYEKVFLQELDDDNLDMFNRFLTALKDFTTEIVADGDGSNELKSVNLGDFSVKSTHISDFNLDIILVVDKEDKKINNKLLPPIIEIIRDHKEIFHETEHSSELFKSFDEQINNLLLSRTNIIDESIVKSNISVFKSVWAQKGAISTKLRDDLIKQKENIIKPLEKEDNYPNKLLLLKKLMNILEKLNEKDDFIKTQIEAKLLSEEIRVRKIKLKYYLDLTKDALKYKEYNKAYSNLYSFSSKLKNMAKPQVQEKYHMIATILAKKDNVPKIELSQAVSEILISPNNIDEYLP